VNIHGATSKLERSNIIELFNKYDVVFLSELKHTYPLTIPGFQYIRSRVITEEEHRGGVGILIKQYLWPEVHDIDINHDQVWFSLQSVPDTVFGAIYISPRDSPYYRPQSFATIQEHCNCENVFILGDFNARLSSLNKFKNPTRNIDYTPNPDGIINANGRELLSLCESNGLIPVNHLQLNQTSCEGGLTYKKKQRWISQLDWAICTESAAKYVQSFNILHCEELRTDHAALSLQIGGFERSPSHLLDSAKQLDSYIVNKPNENRLIKRPIPFSNVNQTMLIDNLPPTDILWHLTMDSELNMVCDCLVDTIYKATKQASITPNTPTCRYPQEANDRWKNILYNKDDKQIWKSINWKGSIDSPNTHREKPSNTEFCTHFEALLNPPDTTDPREYIPIHQRYIPILDDPIDVLEVLRCTKKLRPNKAAGSDGIPPAPYANCSVVFPW
jgi:hypothetical protein